MSINVSDGTLNRIELSAGRLHVEIKLYDSSTLLIEFTDVLGFEALNLPAEDLGDFTEATSDPVIDHYCHMLGESEGNLKLFSLLSAWDSKPVLRVVAQGFSTTQRLPNEDTLPTRGS